MTSELHPGLAPRSVSVAGAGVGLVCCVWGDERDPTAILVHGNGGHARWWDPLVPWLVPGWRLVVPHLRGHGESDWAEPPRYALEDFVRDLDAVVRALAVLDSRFDPIDPAFAAKYRSSIAGKREGRRYASRDEAMAAFRFIPDEPGVAPDVVAHLAAHAVHERAPGAWTFRFDRGVLSADGDGAGDLRARFPQVRCPTFVGAGARSWLMPAAELARIRAGIPQMQAQVFPGAHHFLVRCPEAVGPVLRAFLDGTSERR